MKITQLGRKKTPKSKVKRKIGNYLNYLKSRFDSASNLYFNISEVEPKIFECDLAETIKLEYCAVCGSNDKIYLYEKKIYPNPYNLCACNKCGHLYIDKPCINDWGEGEGKHGGAHGDEEEYTGTYVSNIVSEHKILAKKGIQFVADTIGDLKNKKALDYHFDLGGYSNEMLKYDMMVDGHEPSSENKKIAKEYFNIDETYQNDDMIKNDYYDFINIVRVFNHFYEPRHFVELIKKKCKIGGHLYIVIKNGLMDIRRNGPWSASKRDHPHIFTEYSMTNLLCNSGFKIVAMEGVGDEFEKFNTHHHLHIIAEKTDEQINIGIKNYNNVIIHEYNTAMNQYLHY
ncbi:class I SAM-dependent methyltransferase, partial [Verrucomicrobia bacterium]|nr:class I SAM-dependent methyltransferase [Verrucomicrobiota bacterium]